jgi:hypothetical protein
MESFVRVILYDLNCDHPEHDRKAYADRTSSDPESSEYRSDDWQTVGDARRHARLAGWILRGNGVAICPDCARGIH